MTTVFILNEAPYGSERSYNALRLAKAGLGEQDLVEGAHRGTLGELAAWTAEADTVLVF